MLKIESVVLPSPEQWQAVIRGTRNPMNSWNNSDSKYGCGNIHCIDNGNTSCDGCTEIELGDNDLCLMKKLSAAGTDHSKYLRMIPVFIDIVAPLYWWSEYDTYKVGTVANSCSKMHKIHSKDLTLDDFSHDNMNEKSIYMLNDTIIYLNAVRKAFVETKDKMYWWQMIQLLPSSYNQRRTVMLNYQVLKNIYKSRRTHKLDEWVDFCKWIETLPYAELIVTGQSIGNKDEDDLK